jgi:DNA mismatch repair protein MSH2
MVEYFGNESALRLELFSKLKTLPSIEKALKRFEGLSISSPGEKSGKSKPPRLSDCVDYYKFSKSVLEIMKILQGSKFFSEDLEKFRSLLEDLIELVSKGIDLESAKTLDLEYRVNSEFDERLREIHKDIQEVDNEINNLRNMSTEMLGLSKPLQLIHLASHGILFEGNKVEIYDGMRNPIPLTFNIVSHLQRTVKISCQELREMNKRKESSTALYLTSQIDLEQRIIELVSNHTRTLKDCRLYLSELDAVLALSHVCFTSAKAYTRPHINKSDFIELKNCRHPSCDEIIEVVPNSIKMEKSSSSFVLITGPNMGGKSTFLRTVAIAVVLAHIGSFVPAEFASVCLVDKVIARIGAGDNQLQGQSTFMCEMVELADMIEAATNDSLLIIDEIGRGTSSSEGAGIAQGVCEYLSRLGCFTLFATHFSELISQDLRNFKVVQTEVILRNLSFELTHKILPGASNESYGIDIAEGNGIPAEIIEEAREIKKIFEELNCLINYG